MFYNFLGVKVIRNIFLEKKNFQSQPKFSKIFHNQELLQHFDKNLKHSYIFFVS